MHLHSTRGPRGARWIVGIAAAVLIACAAGERPQPSVVPLPGREAVETRLVLIGDAGNPDPRGEPVLRALSADIAGIADRTMVVFLGDNVYPRGMPQPGAPGRAEAERRLAALVDAVRQAGARGVFLPGNHDWERGGTGGWEAVRREEEFIAKRAAGSARLVPSGGCPGPTTLDAGPRIVVVALDTQWWLQDSAQPHDPMSGCRADTPAEVADSLRAAIVRAQPRHVVVVGHHPLASSGPHGGHFPWTAHVFPLRALAPWLWVPLPLVGSIYPLARRLGAARQDLSSGAYRRMRVALETAMGPHAVLIYAGGHDHSLQVMEGTSARYMLVSGAGYHGHANSVGRRADTRFARAANGFIRVDVLRNGRVRLGVIVVDPDGVGREVYSQWLE